MIRDCWVQNGGVGLHYLDSWSGKNDRSATPLVYIPGRLGFAETFRSEMELLAPRRCLSISLRGHGQSDSPVKGYKFEDYLSDIEAIIRDADIEPFCLMAYSAGVPLAIRYTVHHPEKVAGLFLIDYPARNAAIPDSWVERVLNHPSNNFDPAIIRTMQAESREILLWDQLPDIRCPVLILYGGAEDSLLKEDGVERYRQKLPHARFVCFEDSGHEVWKPDYDRMIRTFKEFLSHLDATAR